MIYCCGGYHTPDKTVSILPTFKYRERKLEVMTCPTCGAIVAVLTQYNVNTMQYETIRPKKKKTMKFLQDINDGKLNDVKVFYGSKVNSTYVFGVNKEAKDGKIYQYAVDFNGVKKLVKVIE